MPIEERSFATIKAAACALAEDLASTLNEAISARGQGTLAVSGGRTPRYVFELLRELGVDWSRVTLTLTDERWVPPEHLESNEHLVRSCLLQGPPASATFVPLYGGEDSPVAGQTACEARLRKIEMPFDGMYLGMGSDGHFASLFPGDNAVNGREGRCIVVPASEFHGPRMSLTFPTIMNARKVFLLFSGADKQAMYLKARKAGATKDIPLSLLLSQTKAMIRVLSAP